MFSKFVGVGLLVLVLFQSCKDEPSVHAVKCLPAELHPYIIAFYPFTEGSFTDLSKNGNSLKSTGKVFAAKDRMDNERCAVMFNDTNTDETFLSTKNTTFLNGLNEFSVSMWFFAQDTHRLAGAYEALLGRGNVPHCPDRIGEWSLGLYDCRQVVFAHDNSVWYANSKTETCRRIVELNSNHWVHVVGIKGINYYELYVDGELKGRKEGVANCTTLYRAQDIGDLRLGYLFNGKIDDVIIFNKALTSKEVSILNTLSTCCEN